MNDYAMTVPYDKVLEVEAVAKKNNLKVIIGNPFYIGGNRLCQVFCETVDQARVLQKAYKAK